MLKNKKILIGITASIAAYKIATLIRLLVKDGAIVKVIMTPSAKDFITPLTIATLSKNEVLSDFYDPKTGVWTNHVDLGLWADVLLIAPLSANTLAKMANGICDNLLLATYLSNRSKTIVAPAMDLDMYQHQTVQLNLKKLISFGNIVLEAQNGELASGLSGQGRMAEPEDIFTFLQNHFSSPQPLVSKKIVITVGPTKEAIDPVRYISNHSTGKMGIAIVKKLLDLGADVTLVHGNITIPVPVHKNLTAFKIDSADEMYSVCQTYFSTCDAAIFSAAVADYKVKNVAKQKIKKNESAFTIDLVKNIDIALEFGNQKKENQLSIGFALETTQELENAQSKLERKKFDLIVLNSMNDANATFGYDTNKVTFVKKNSTPIAFSLKSKEEVAQDLVNEIVVMFNNIKTS